MRYPHSTSHASSGLRFWLFCLMLPLSFVNWFWSNAPLNAAQSNPVAVVSAASYETTALAPGAIAAAFGVQLATRTETAATVPLPTNLAGTSVRLRDSAGNERLAALFFVSGGQINFAIPAEMAAGAATISVVAGDGVQSQGTLDIKAVAPAIFTANADGRGVPAAVALRVKADNQQLFESISETDALAGRFRPRPIDLSPAGDRVFLLLFYSGTLHAADANNDGNRNESVKVLLGGVMATPDYAGPQGQLVGLDQINLELPRSLIGSGRISLSVTAGGLTSNTVEIELAAPAGNAPPVINGFNNPIVLAGQPLEIQGNGFAGNATENLVRIGGVEAQVTNVTAGRLTALVPTGAETGVVSVRTPQGEGRSNEALRIRTSISGLVENTERAPLKDVTVRVRQNNASVNTAFSGSFVLPDPQGTPLGAIVEVDGSRLPVAPPFGKVSFLLPFSANRDNQIARPITLQQSYGTATQVGGQGLQAEEELTLSVATYAPNATAQTPAQIQTGEVTLSFQPNTTFLFPDGARSGTLTLTQVERSRTPVALPTGVFSSTIVQITPFGTKFTPAARLTFPNADNFPANATVRLYRLDQTENSATLGRFIDSGAATVSADGKQIVSALGTVPEATYYFASLERNTTSVIGRVLESNGSPARRALVRVRGQEDFTDGNGGFVIRNVPVSGSNDFLIVEASLVRSPFRVDRTESNRTTAIAGGVTDVGTLTLPAASSNQPPYVLLPPGLTLTAGTTRDVVFVAADPDSEQPVQVNFTGPAFARLQSDNRTIRFSPGVNDVGLHTVTITVTDASGSGVTATFRLTVVRAPNQPPVLTVPGAQTVQPEQTLNFTVTATDPDVGQTLTYAASNLPTGASFNAATRQFSWTPAPAQIGTFTVTFTVTDNGTPPLSDSKTVSITVVAPTTGTVTGVVRNAQTGQVLAGATLAIANSALTTTSNNAGVYTLTNVMPGARVLTASATGFAATQIAINVVAGQTLTQNISLSPTLATGQLRITLNWTKDAAGVPEDLDAHLYGPSGNNQCFHVYFVNKGSLTAPPFAALEVDNIELPGRPPTETIRIAQQTAGTYRFFVHDYNGELADGLSRSRATVQVFGSNGLLRTYVVPSGTGKYWDVFELNGSTGAFTDLNRLTATPPPLTCGNVTCSYSIAPANQSFAASGGTGSASVTTQTNCTWTATSNAGFITITSGASGTGNGTVNYSVAANITTSQRSGTLTIAGQTLTVTQAAATTGLTVRDRRLTAGPIPDGCSPPVAKTAYLRTDERIYQWTLVSGARIGDLVRWDFIQPNGSVALTSNYTVAFNDNVCFWAAMNIAGAAAASLPGNWQVRVFYNNALLFTDNFTIASSILGSADASAKPRKTWPH